ncbi:hypothetical protein [Streptomyces sp. NPDC050504]|uniref:hypothetical protein n=1 Tax=Streptomyces sp. NPDC050504 TaxID=3365618 RepID=UPI0037A68ED2
MSVRSYSTEGGRAVLDLGPRTAALVSASPEPGWAMRVWEDPSWIRVEFSTGTRAVTVFCSWHNHPPLVKVIEN